MILLKLSWLSCGDSLGGTCLEHSGVRFPCSIAAPQPLKVRGSEDFTNMRWSLVLGIKMKVNLLGLVTGLGFQPDWPVEPGQKAPSRAHPLQKGHTSTQFGKLQPHPIGSVTEPLSTAPSLLLLSSPPLRGAHDLHHPQRLGPGGARTQGLAKPTIDRLRLAPTFFDAPGGSEIPVEVGSGSKKGHFYSGFRVAE